MLYDDDTQRLDTDYDAQAQREVARMTDPVQDDDLPALPDASQLTELSPDTDTRDDAAKRGAE